MYKILVDGDVLYDPRLASDGYAITSGTLDLEVNKSGSMTITIPIVSPVYNSFSKMKSMFTVFNRDKEIFRGRLLHDTTDFNKNKELYIEGELAFFLDYVMPTYEYTGNIRGALELYISIYNSQIVGYEDSKHLTVGEVTVSTETNITVGSLEYPTISDELNKLQENYGGYYRIEVRNGIRYIDYLAEPDRICRQTITFGENLLDFEQYVSGEDIITVLIPLGADQRDENGNSIGRVNISSVQTGGNLYVNNVEAERRYGNIWKTVVFDDVTDPVELKRLGEEYLSKYLVEASTITLKAIDLNIIDVDTEQIGLGDYIRIVSAPHGLDDIFQCTAISIDFLNPENSTYTFGNQKTSLTTSSVQQSHQTNAAIEDVNNRVMQETVNYVREYVSAAGRIESNTTEGWESMTPFITEPNVIYVYTDYDHTTDDDDNVVNIPAIKVGDGTTYLVDLPFVSMGTSADLSDHINNRVIHVTQADRNFWNNKVRVYINPNSTDTVVFTTN